MTAVSSPSFCRSRLFAVNNGRRQGHGINCPANQWLASATSPRPRATRLAMCNRNTSSRSVRLKLRGFQQTLFDNVNIHFVLNIITFLGTRRKKERRSVERGRGRQHVGRIIALVIAQYLIYSHSRGQLPDFLTSKHVKGSKQRYILGRH